MNQNKEQGSCAQEEKETKESLLDYYENGQSASIISEEKAEAIAVRLKDISEIIKTYIDLHPDRYQAFLNGERERLPDNPTPLYHTKFREKKK